MDRWSRRRARAPAITWISFPRYRAGPFPPLYLGRGNMDLFLRPLPQTIDSFWFPLSQTISHWLIQSHGLTNQVVLHLAEVWRLAEIYPRRYDVQLMRRWGSMPFSRTQNSEPEISGTGNWKGGGSNSTGTNRKQKNLRIGKRNFLNKKSRTIANQKTSIVLKLNVAEL